MERIRIGSVTDVITNSSSEVYVYQKSSQEFKDLCEFLGPELSREFETYNTLEELWEKEISQEGYGGELMYSTEEQGRLGNLPDWDGLKVDPFDSGKNWELANAMYSLIKDGIKTKREIFDFFAPTYQEALDVAYYSEATDCGGYPSKLVKKISEFYNNQHTEFLRELLKDYSPGDIVYSEFPKDSQIREYYPIGKFITLISEINPEDEFGRGIIPAAIYGEDWLGWDDSPEGLENGFKAGMNFRPTLFTGDDWDTLRMATREEREIFLKALEESRYELDPEVPGKIREI